MCQNSSLSSASLIITIRYLLNNVTNRLCEDIYSLPETTQARHLIQEIEIYPKAHFWISVFCLESVHRYDSIAEMKRILGSLQIVYIDVDDDV